jgi:hypothetical protein
MRNFEIDHTRFDIVENDNTSKVPKERPILTIEIDPFSRYPIGFSLRLSAEDEGDKDDDSHSDD